MDHAQMQKLGEEMWREAIDIKKNAQKIAWYMRGSLQYEDVLNLSSEEMENVNKLIEENLETTKKTRMPFF